MKIVVKVGGSLMKSGPPPGLLDDVASLAKSNQLALVHGGGDMVTEIAEKLGKEQKFVVSPEGIRSRYTDRETAEIYTMVMSGMVAKRLVLLLGERGVRAVSVTGLDGSLLVAKRKKKLVIVDERGRKMLIEGGYTGRVETVNPGLVDALESAGFLPVVSPVASSEESEPLNIDGDRAASALAIGTRADAVVFVTNVGGLMMDEKLVERLSPREAKAVLPRVGFGMQKKVMAAAEAVEGGVKEAVICSGNVPQPVTSALAHRECTVIS
jgi:[amino group carrier protein]-L-2-aminoadipate/L-glutamate 6-kinase